MTIELINVNDTLKTPEQRTNDKINELKAIFLQSLDIIMSEIFGIENQKDFEKYKKDFDKLNKIASETTGVLNLSDENINVPGSSKRLWALYGLIQNLMKQLNIKPAVNNNKVS